MSRAIPVVLALLVALFVGAGAAFLLAPRKADAPSDRARAGAPAGAALAASGSSSAAAAPDRGGTFAGSPTAALAPGEGSLGPAPSSASASPSAVAEAADLTGTGDAAPVLSGNATLPHPAPEMAIDPTVVLRLRVGPAGEVQEARVYRSRLELQRFEEAALAAADRMRFTPPRKAGQPVAAWVNVPLTFVRGEGARAIVPARILFARGVAALPSEAAAALDPVVQAVVTGGKRALVVGHADDAGDAAANQRLALARAQAIATRLTGAGAPDQAVTVQASAAEATTSREPGARADVFLVSP